MRRHAAKHAVCDIGHVWVIAIKVAFGEGCDRRNPDRQNVPEFAQQTADHVGHLGMLSDSEIAGAMD